MSENICKKCGRNYTKCTCTLGDSKDATIAALREEIDKCGKHISSLQYQLLESLGKEDGMNHAYHRMKDDLAALTKERDRLEAELSESKIADYLIQINTLTKERDELKKLNLSTICAYCGTFFEADSDGRKVDALQAHMKICIKHPMREIEKERDELKRENEMLKNDMENWKHEFGLQIDKVQSLQKDNYDLRTRLAEANNELDTLRKVV